MIFFFSKQTHAPKVLMQMARPLLLPLFGFGGFPKLIEPRPIPLDKVPLWGGLVFLRVQTVFFQEGDWHKPIAPWLILPGLDLRECVFHPSSQRRLR